MEHVMDADIKKRNGLIQALIFAASLIGDKLKKYDDAIERNGFATVLYLRKGDA